MSGSRAFLRFSRTSRVFNFFISRAPFNFFIEVESDRLPSLIVLLCSLPDGSFTGCCWCWLCWFFRLLRAWSFSTFVTWNSYLACFTTRNFFKNFGDFESSVVSSPNNRFIIFSFSSNSIRLAVLATGLIEADAFNLWCIFILFFSSNLFDFFWHFEVDSWTLNCFPVLFVLNKFVFYQPNLTSQIY